MLSRWIPLGLGLAALAAGGARAATVTTAWEATAAGQDICLAIGAEAVQRTGFRAAIAHDRQAVFGWRGEDNISIRCISDRGVAVFFVYTVDGRDNAQLLEILRTAYQQPGAALKR